MLVKTTQKMGGMLIKIVHMAKQKQLYVEYMYTNNINIIQPFTLLVEPSFSFLYNLHNIPNIDTLCEVIISAIDPR